MATRCDCLNVCGDDSRLSDGSVAECDYRARQRALRPPELLGISRMADNNKAILISFKESPTDDQLRALHDKLSALASQPL